MQLTHRRLALPLFIVCALCALLAQSCGSEETDNSADSDSTDSTMSDGDTSVDTGMDTDTGTDVGDTDVAADTDAATDVPVDTDTATDLVADVPVDMPPVGSQGCVDGMGLPEGENTFMLEGLSRRYVLRLPNGYTNTRPWPVVLALHGNGSGAGYWDSTSGNRDIRSVLQDDAILIIAEAIDNQWRDYSADSSTWPGRIEQELRYFEEVLTQARTQLCINEDEIFSMGFSGGGSFSGVLACRRSDIRAIAVGGSVIYFDEMNCGATPAAWIVISEGDVSGGRTAYRDFFRDGAMCQATSVATDPSPCVAYDGCGQGTPVHYCEPPGGHAWPDFGSQGMWDFFSQFVTAP